MEAQSIIHEAPTTVSLLVPPMEKRTGNAQVKNKTPAMPEPPVPPTDTNNIDHISSGTRTVHGDLSDRVRIGVFAADRKGNRQRDTERLVSVLGDTGVALVKDG